MRLNHHLRFTLLVKTATLMRDTVKPVDIPHSYLLVEHGGTQADSVVFEP